jgi:phosphoribosylformylglycinamidine synthase
LHETITALITQSLVAGAHDISEGGLFVCLMESAMANGLGFDVTLPSGIKKDVYLFSESQSRIVISVHNENLTTVEGLLAEQGIPFERLGTIRGSSARIDGVDFGAVSDWTTSYQNALSAILEQE